MKPIVLDVKVQLIEGPKELGILQKIPGVMKNGLEPWSQRRKDLQGEDLSKRSNSLSQNQISISSRGTWV